ncbi:MULTISPECIES: MFS transporter [Ferrimicrobium]|uniref:MFS transporter n=1 Tax=Ferrimicrobium acidiphilum TaxID=121039 RepID=A0ABV3Y2E8_9ACTN|nr:MFS transporter [Ferrimicrobium sp.]
MSQSNQRRPARTLAVLRDPVIQRLTIARGFVSLAMGMLPVSLSFTILRLLHSATDLGLIFAAESVTMVITIAGAGVLADRLSRKHLLILADLLFGLSMLSTGLLAITGIHALTYYLVAAALIGLADALFVPAFEGWAQAVIPAHQRQQAAAVRSIYRNIGAIAGPFLAALLVAVFSAPLSLIAGGILPLIGGAIFTQLPDGRGAQTTSSFLSQLASGWNSFRSRTWIWTVDLQFALWHVLVWAPIMVLGPVLADHYYHGAGGWALIWAGAGVGGVIGGLAAFRFHPKFPVRAGTLAMMLLAPAMIGLAVHANIWLTTGATLVGGAGLEFFGALWSYSIQTHVPSDVVSKVASFDFLASVAFLPIGLVIAVPMAHLISTEGVFFLAAGYLVFSAVLVLLVPSVRNLARTSST